MAAFALPISVFILVNFLRDVPRSLVEAMELDGAGRVRILISLTAPLAMPAIVTVAIFDLIQSWNNFLFPLILTQSSEISTLPLAVWAVFAAFLSWFFTDHQLAPDGTPDYCGLELARGASFGVAVAFAVQALP